MIFFLGQNDFFFCTGEKLIPVLNRLSPRVLGRTLKDFFECELSWTRVSSFINKIKYPSGFLLLREVIFNFSLANLRQYFSKRIQAISGFTFGFYFLAMLHGPSEWDFRTTSDPVLGEEASPLTQTWCFLARILNGIDPFDLSRWTPSSMYPKEVMREYVLAPEFTNTYSEWLLRAAELRVDSNFFFVRYRWVNATIFSF